MGDEISESVQPCFWLPDNPTCDIFFPNVTRGGDWVASRYYAWQKALASVPGAVRGPSFLALHLLWVAIIYGSEDSTDTEKPLMI